MKNLIYLFLLSLIGFSASANVSLPAFFSDNMVLQRNSDVKLWGWGSPNEEITVTASWDAATYKVKAGNQATWQIIIKTPKEGGPYTLKFKGYNEVVFNNVMLGEVWLCSGQSNMEWTAASGIDNAVAEIAAANYPDIRFFAAPKLTAIYPQNNLSGAWQACTPETMKYFSAIGYFFAQHLQEGLKGVPIGIINCSWGGTNAEVWMPQDYIAKDAVLASAAAKFNESEWWPREPGRVYNAMIHPFAGLRLAGVLWYQGESNVGSVVYHRTFAGLIKSWREAWHDDFPFYYVQIAPYNYQGDSSMGALTRNEQRKVLQAVPKTGMVVISDVGNINDIHPRNKKPVGVRLANLALGNLYGIDNGIVSSPLYKDFKVSGNKATINFDNADGLHFSNKKSDLFEVAGNDGVFHPATAEIKKNAVIVTSKEVKKPEQVRYAWRNTAIADLFNKANLPASSFTSEVR
ncbi:sialate O-acetylesterase [Pedobacter sp. W3I1]|uniref:sialate O-acetylesterase n=1 Tax=Pedobacter sp. W3I1 TaxID=3042291 RepID=UPI0027897D00|nr:sialate O-acetylesterase [Pedobacter sp. W3I1]MDQ0638428.1 sialate O-acetylesterase [Pedobacter sp. W3I1]